MGLATLKNCNCYVANLDNVNRFTLRYGAHSLSCPVYRESRDPLDKFNDTAARNHFTKGLKRYNLVDEIAKQIKHNTEALRS